VRSTLKTAVDVAAILLVSLALVWIGGAGALADMSRPWSRPTSCDSPVQDESVGHRSHVGRWSEETSDHSEVRDWSKPEDCDGGDDDGDGGGGDFGPVEDDSPSTPVSSSSATTRSSSTSTTTPVADSSSSSSAREDRACADYTSQAAAQGALDDDLSDPNNLDVDQDGIACESHFGTQDQQVAVHPQGGVQTGGTF